MLDTSTDSGIAPQDSGTDAATDATTDASSSAGFGSISGTCGVLDTELMDTLPVLFHNEITFDREFQRSTDTTSLFVGAQDILSIGTVGGSSELSEAFSFEMLSRCETAEMLKTETEVLYDGPGKKTDMLVSIDGIPIGVSVVRAMSFPRDAGYSVAQAQALVEHKLDDILMSTAHVSVSDTWQKQILYVVADTSTHLNAVVEAYPMIPEATRSDTIVIVTLTNGTDDFIYTN